MEFITVFIIALGLAMDAFAVSVATGAAYKQLKIRHAVRMALFFGAFQAVMPLIGWAVGLGLESTIAAFDHWLAFGLLTAIGAKMIYESMKLKTDQDQSKDPENLLVLLILSVATSIDALAVGVTLTIVTSRIFTAVTVIGVVTFVMSYIGCVIGRKVGHFFENRIEMIGGLVLIAIGTKILIQHLMAG